MGLIEAANDSLAGVKFDENRPIPPMTYDQIIRILGAHAASVKGGDRKKPGWQAQPKPLEEMRESIIRKVEAIVRDEMDRAGAIEGEHGRHGANVRRDLGCGPLAKDEDERGSGSTNTSAVELACNPPCARVVWQGGRVDPGERHASGGKAEEDECEGAEHDDPNGAPHDSRR